MRPVPIPDGVAEQMGGMRVVIGDPDPTRDDMRPAEYVVTESTVYPGRPCLSALVVLDDEDRANFADGGGLWLSFDGGELPWSLTSFAPVIDPEEPTDKMTKPIPERIEPDDVLIRDVSMFRMEQLDDGLWWMCCHRKDGSEVTYHFTSRTEITCSVNVE